MEAKGRPNLVWYSVDRGIQRNESNTKKNLIKTTTFRSQRYINQLLFGQLINWLLSSSCTNQNGKKPDIIVYFFTGQFATLWKEKKFPFVQKN